MTSRIEWLKNADGKHGYTINPVKGLCPVACSYCYARRMYKRFKWNPEIRYDTGWEFGLPSKPSKIFVGSTMELFGDWVKPVWRQDILQVAGAYSQHTFIFLTKRPENLPNVFPDNCWVGVSLTGKEKAGFAYPLVHIQAGIKFLSIEPLLAPHPILADGSSLKGADIGWLIIGQQTPSSEKTKPKMDWIQEILVAASNADNIPVFMKNNLEPLLTGIWSGWKLRQEFPVISFSKD